MSDVFKNPRYRGKHVNLTAAKLYTAKTGEGAAEILRKIRIKYSTVIPEISYIPNGSFIGVS